MAIPGLKPSFEVRAKVRVGVKKEVTRRDGTRFEVPASVDHFVCDDEDFVRVCGDQPKTITVLLPYERPEDNFSTGLERWDGQMLTCYSKGETVGHSPVPVAWRKPELRSKGRTLDLLDGFERVDRTAGKDRQGVVCRARNCPDMISKACKPMGRLQFFLPDVDPSGGVYQIDTKSWNSIEKVEAFLSVLGDPRGRPLSLSVEFWNRGQDRFPVLTLGVPVEINSDSDAILADRLVMLRSALEDGQEAVIKQHLAFVLDHTNPGWRDSEGFVHKMKERIADVGVAACATTLLGRYEL